MPQITADEIFKETQKLLRLKMADICEISELYAGWESWFKFELFLHLSRIYNKKPYWGNEAFQNGSIGVESTVEIDQRCREEIKGKKTKQVDFWLETTIPEPEKRLPVEKRKYAYIELKLARIPLSKKSESKEKSYPEKLSALDGIAKDVESLCWLKESDTLASALMALAFVYIYERRDSDIEKYRDDRFAAIEVIKSEIVKTLDGQAGDISNIPSGEKLTGNCISSLPIDDNGYFHLVCVNLEV